MKSCKLRKVDCCFTEFCEEVGNLYDPAKPKDEETYDTDETDDMELDDMSVAYYQCSAQWSVHTFASTGMSRDFRAFPTSTTKTFRIAVVFFILPHLGNVDGGLCSNSIQEDNDRKPRLIAVTEPVQHGEGPHWDAHNQLLYFVDISGNTVHRLNPSTNMHTAITLNDSVSFVIPIRGRVNQFIIGLGRSLAVLHWDGVSPTFQVFVKESVDNDRPNNRFNDAKADPWGRLWTGTMGEEKPIGNVQLNQGRLYRWSMVKCRLEPQLSPVSISNGIAWTNDMKFMYYADSPTRRIDAFDYDGRSIRNRRIIFDFIINNVPGNPDGMTIDRWNMLWIACWGGSRVIQVDPQRSQLLKTILMPVERVTSVTFGGALLDILYVTSMRTGLNETQLKSQPMAGTTFAVTNLGTRGTINNPAQFYCVHRKRLKHYSG